MRAPINFLSAVARPRFHPATMAAISLITLAGCAQQQQPGYYEPPKESTLSDARSQAQGRQDTRAPSQLQLGFGKDQTEQSPAETQDQEATESGSADQTNVIRPLREPKNFSGHFAMQHDPAVMLSQPFHTYAGAIGRVAGPSTAFRRPGNQRAVLEQGCWKVIGTEPWRIRLQTRDDTTLSALTFEHNNLLRVNSMNNVEATLPFHLTRQADIDGINELKDQPAMNCRP